MLVIISLDNHTWAHQLYMPAIACSQKVPRSMCLLPGKGWTDGALRSTSIWFWKKGCSSQHREKCLKSIFAWPGDAVATRKRALRLKINKSWRYYLPISPLPHNERFWREGKDKKSRLRDRVTSPTKGVVGYGRKDSWQKYAILTPVKSQSITHPSHR